MVRFPRPLLLALVAAAPLSCGVAAGDADDSGASSSSSSSSSGGGRPGLEACGYSEPGATAAAIPLTAANVQDFIDAHNQARCHAQPVPTRMPALTWDDKLAAVAQAYADQCLWEHNAARTADYAAAGGSGYVGENLYASAPSAPNPAGTVRAWASESVDFDYASNACTGEMCGHYTQVVWANTSRVGCGHAFCAGGLEGAPGLTHMVVCDYAPGGNIVGQRPFSAGP